MDNKRVADYFIIAGLPDDPEKQTILDESSLEVNLKPSHNQEPITDITVIFPGLGENVPDYYQLLDTTPTGHPADLNHGSFRAPEVFICFRRGRNKPPLVDLGVLYEGKETPKPGFQLVEFTPNGHQANVNNSTNSSTYITYRRATDLSPCNELVITEVTIVITNKGEEPPHSFVRIDKNLNKSMLGSGVYLCFKRSMNRPEHISMTPALLDRYPISNNPAFPLEDNIALFCLPMGATLECWPCDTIRTTTPSTFVLTLQNYQRVYGSCISFYEDYSEARLTETQRKQLKLENWKNPVDRKIIAKKCICFLSMWPFFEAFEKFLFFLYKRILMGPHEIPVERFISHFLYNVPFPSPERPRILVQLSKTDKIALYQPQELPLPRSGASFRHLITTLGPDNAALLLLLAITEQKILIHSLRSNLLTSVAEAMMQIIFPFTWQCPYIPLCPVGKSDFISAPFPFVIGLDTRFFDLYELPSDVNAVDLDTNTISLCSTSKKMNLSIRLLPKRPARILRDTLAMLQEKCLQYNRLAQELEMTSDDGALDFEFKLREKESELELEIQEAFLQFMAGALGGYRQHLLPITRAPTVGVTDVRNLFDRDTFLRSRDRAFHPFYDHMMNTQLFTKFIEECSFVSDVNQSLAFFDECVDRLDRNEGGRLLDGEGARSDTTIFILPPDSSDLPAGVEYKYNTLQSLDHSLFLDQPNDFQATSEDSSNLESLVAPSSVAQRTKQEIKSAVRLARKQNESPLLWSKCMLATCYSLWYLTLPSMVLKAQGSISTIRSGHHILQRMQRLRLHPVDEICYRVMMQLCGIYSQPVLAVKVLFQMKRCGVHPNAVTYGYYNKAVAESEWPHGIANSSQLLWHKLRNVLTAVWLFKQAGRSFRRMEDSVSQLNLAEDNKEEEKEEDKDDVDAQLTKESADESAVPPEERGEGVQGGGGGGGDDVERKMTRTRSFSIVKPPPPKEGEPGVETLAEEGMETLKEEDGGEGEEVEGKPELANELSEESASKPQVVRYTDIRNKFPNLIKSGAAKTLFKAEGEVVLPVAGEDPTRLEEESKSDSLGVPEDGNLSGSRVSLSKVSVVENDPLGALSQPDSGDFKSLDRTKEGGELSHRSMSMSDVLGEPFRTPDNKDNQAASHMHRSCTMPLRGELGGSNGELRNNGGAGYLGSFSSLAGSGLKSLAGSKAANLGMRKGKALLSAWSSLSPQNNASTKEALNTIKTWSNSAATNLSKKYEEMVQQSPASSRTDEASEEDQTSQTSQLSDQTRRPSESQADGLAQDTWGTLANAFNAYIWGDNQKVPQPQTQRAADITEQFETLYSRENNAQEDTIVSMTVYITTCSRCRQCGGVLFDEEIMAGWSPEDSNLNTVCAWCKQRTVPTLSIQVFDYRESAKDFLKPQTNPKALFPISIPYISPLVLRKEMESVLHKEGDKALIDPMCPDLHPILYWNLLYFFHRIATPSHLPDLLTATPSLKLTSLHPTWTNLDKSSVKIITNWDNPALYSPDNIPLHILWKQRNCGTDPLALHPLMQSVIAGVKENNLLNAVKAILSDRKRRSDRASNSSLSDTSLTEAGDTPHKLNDTPSMTTPNCQVPVTPANMNSTPEAATPFRPPATPSGATTPFHHAKPATPSSAISTPGTPPPRALDGRDMVSVYRQMLFLTLVSLGQDNIDLTAFDREYRRAFEKLTLKQLSLIHPCDHPPGLREVFCRKLFRDLRV